ncbi:MAG: hypothetical protein ACW98A_17145 [Candidatus Hodarchaeales archaeon]|jgi:hypothetical protein
MLNNSSKYYGLKEQIIQVVKEYDNQGIPREEMRIHPLQLLYAKKDKFFNKF